MAKKPAINIVVLGGTIASEATPTTISETDVHGKSREVIRCITKPKHGKILELLNFQMPDDVKERYPILPLVKESEVFLDSADFEVDTLERAVQGVRDILRETKGNIIICTGTDSSAYLSQAMADGISPEALGGRSVVITMAQYASPKRPDDAEGPINQGKSDAANNLANALRLSMDSRMNGQIGTVVGSLLRPARGTRKREITGPDPLDNRFFPIAHSNNASIPNWLFDNPQNVNYPTGLTNVRYKLLPGVESYSVDPFSNYQNLVDIMEFASKKNPRTLNAMILSAPGSCNLRNNPRDHELIERAADIGLTNGIPLIVTSDPMHRQERGEECATYAGNAFNRRSGLIDGRRMMVPELKVVVAQSLYTAKKIKKIADPATLGEYVDTHLDCYSDFVEGKIAYHDYMEMLREMRH